MISAGVEGRLPYMTYPEPWRGPPKQPPELFLRPKPLPSTTRYNGVSQPTGNGTGGGAASGCGGGAAGGSYPNGTRLAPPPARPITKYASPPSIAAPVNLVQTKEEQVAATAAAIAAAAAAADDRTTIPDMSAYSPYRLFPHAQFPHFPYPICQQPYMLRTSFPPTPLSPMETFSPTAPTATSTFLSPPSTFSPPTSVKPPTQVQQTNTILRDKRTPPAQHQSQGSPLAPPRSPLAPPLTPSQSQAAAASSAAFKVPSGKEGSLKHRILTRPEDNVRTSGPLDLQKSSEGRKRLQATMSPPRSPKRTINNNTMSSNFTKGSLIQLHNGELRRIEDMRTEDFVMSADRSPELRLAESTVVRIEESHSGTATITLTYNQRRAQVEVESSSSHPYFVMGAGWASCDPAATHLRYGLNVHKLQVGDVLISLTPREPPTPQSAAMSYTSSCSPASSSTAQSLCGNGRSVAAAASTVMTTATATAVTARQQLSSVNSNTSNSHHTPHLLATSSLLLKSSTQVSNHQQHQSQHSPVVSAQSQPINLHFSSHAPTIAPPMSPDSAAAAAAARKRRWSAPDEMCEEAELQIRRHRPSGHTPPE